MHTAYCQVPHVSFHIDFFQEIEAESPTHFTYSYGITTIKACSKVKRKDKTFSHGLESEIGDTDERRGHQGARDEKRFCVRMTPHFGNPKGKSLWLLHTEFLTARQEQAEKPETLSAPQNGTEKEPSKLSHAATHILQQ